MVGFVVGGSVRVRSGVYRVEGWVFESWIRIYRGLNFICVFVVRSSYFSCFLSFRVFICDIGMVMFFFLGS